MRLPLREKLSPRLIHPATIAAYGKNYRANLAARQKRVSREDANKKKRRGS
jgi:hypothetical protein